MVIAMVKINDLLNDFRRMLREHWSYGADTREGNVDCSGAFVWSFRQHGASIYHGSNYIARNEVDALRPMSSAKAGMAAFKKRVQGSDRYDLPAKYRAGGVYCNGDLNDYYHIGLIDTDGTILNAQSKETGFVRSKPDKWDYCGYLRKVDYSGFTSAADSSDKHSVTVTGGALNVRKTPSKSATRIGQIPDGSPVKVLVSMGQWAKIDFDGKTGYVMTKYLKGV